MAKKWKGKKIGPIGVRAPKSVMHQQFNQADLVNMLAVDFEIIDSDGDEADGEDGC